MFQIAIDGPVASGKGAVARLLAEKLGFLYVDTGAMYRAVALAAMQQNIPLDNEEDLAAMISHLQIIVRPPQQNEQDGRPITVLLNGEDVSWQIRSKEVGANSSKVAVFGSVRQALVKLQQALAAENNLVMEGRDITFRVLPQANLKIYLTASLAERAKRRWQDLHHQDETITYEQVYQDLLERDQRDTERGVDPLQVRPDAWVLDTSHLSINEVVDKIAQRVNQI